MNGCSGYKFKKEERLTGKKSIDLLFKIGIHINKFPIRVIFNIVYDDLQKYPAKVLFGISKKKFKRAVKRNLIKRRMREAYRLNKNLLYTILNDKKKKIHIAFIYEGTDITDFKTIEQLIKEIFIEISKRLSEITI